MSNPDFVLAIHGGAGAIARNSADTAPFHTGLRQALLAGNAILQEGGSALDAVQAAVVALEDYPLCNAGRASVYTSDQTHEMDAAVMDGSDLRAGAIAAVHGVRNPVSLPRRVMETSGAILLAGAGAQRFAAENGMVTESAEYFHSEY